MNKNKKIFIKFICIMIISAIIGGLLGYYGSSNSESIKGIFEILELKLVKISPILLLASGLILVFLFKEYQKGKKAVEKAIQTQNDEDFELADKLLENAVVYSMYNTVFSFISFGIVLSGLSGIYEFGKDMIILLFSSLIFIIQVFTVIFAQNKIVKLIKIISPEKNGNVFDTKFQEDWFESCDEAEILAIGKAAYKSYVATSRAIIYSFIICMLVGTFLPIGPYPIIIIGMIWLVQSYTYAKWSKSK